MNAPVRTSPNEWAGVALLVALAVVCCLLWLPILGISGDGSGLLLPEEANQDGTELLVVFIGSSTCPAASAEWMPAAMKAMQATVTAEADRLGYSVAFLGAAMDQDIDAGLGFLKKMGRFHEVSVGRSWMNSASVQYLLRDHAAKAAIPQIAVFSRSVVRDGEFLEVSPDRLLERRIGLDEIRAWEALGFPLRITSVAGS